jgi:hypothetical protein
MLDTIDSYARRCLSKIAHSESMAAIATSKKLNWPGCPQLARNRSGAMPSVWSRSGGKRTQRGHRISIELAPLTDVVLPDRRANVPKSCAARLPGGPAIAKIKLINNTK